MLRPGFPLLALCLAGALRAEPAPAARLPSVSRPEQTTDNSRQIVVSGKSLSNRIEVMHTAGEIRESVLAGLHQPARRYPTARPILLVLNPSFRPTQTPRLQIVEDPGGLKLQLDFSPDIDTKSTLFARTVIRALLVELSLRAQPNAGGDSIPVPPRWMVDALLHRFRSPDLFLALDSLRPLLDSGQFPPMARILARPENAPDLSSHQDESVARCLLSLLTDQHESGPGILRLLQDSLSEANALERLLRHFPSLGSSPADLHRVWTLHLAAQGTLRERVVLTGRQTLAELKQLLEIDLTDSAGNRTVYQIEQFSDYIRLAGARQFLALRRLELLALIGRGHFYYSEAIRIYSEVCGALLEGKTTGQAAQLRKAAELRDRATTQLEGIRDYLNWYEAEKAPKKRSQFEEVYRMWDEMEPIPRNPFISRALDAWELRLKTESERLKKETEEADIERALRESRARSLNQR